MNEADKMKSLPILLSLTCLAIGCNESAQQPDHFFPIDEGGAKGVSAFEEQWYSEHLRLMKEGPLHRYAKGGKAQIYRFTLLPTWGDPRSARLSKTKDGFNLTFARLDGDGGYDPGKLVEAASLNISPEQAAPFLNLFADLDFFSQPSRDEMTGGRDGSQWILEAVNGGKYHILVRWSPTAYDPERRGTVKFVQVCKWLLDHAPRAGRQPPPDDEV